MRLHLSTPLLGSPDEPCSECGRPLAGDQRYCLACGARRGEPRVDFRAMLAPAVAAVRAMPEQVGRGRSVALPKPLAFGMTFVLAAGIVLGALFGPSGDPQAATRYVIAAPPAGAPPAIAAGGQDATSAAGTDLSSLGAEPAAAGSDGVVEDTASEAVASSSEPAAEPSVPLTEETPVEEEDETDETPTTEAETGPAIAHVFTIVLDSPGYEFSFGPQTKMPFLGRELAGKGVLLTKYTAIGDGALANRIAMVSGQPPNAQTSAGCPKFTDVKPGTLDDELLVQGEGCVYPSDAETLASQLTTLGLGSRTYSEDMAKAKPAACRHPQVGADDDTQAPRPGDAFAVSLSPFTYFHGVIDAPDCKAALVDLGKLEQDLKAGADAPAFAYIAPNACHSGAPVDPALCPGEDPDPRVRADLALRELVTPILASKAYADKGLLFVTFAGAEKGERVGGVLVSAEAEPGSESAKAYDHHSFLRTIEESFGLGLLGRARAARTQPFGGDVFAGVPSEQE